MTRMKELLGEYGIDWDATMPRFAYDMSLYLKCFDLYLRDDNLAKLKDALAARDFEAGFFAAHTLKGVTANMGFEALCRAVCAIVEPLRAKNANADYDALFAIIAAQADKLRVLREKVGTAV